MTQTTLLNTLKVDTVNWLADQLIDEVTGDSPVGLVRAGKLQDDPTIAELNILVRDGFEDWKHERATGYHRLKDIGAYTMTDGSFWLRRFKVQLTLFFVGEPDRDVALETSNLILARAQHALMAMAMPAGADSFGESAVLLDVADAYLLEGGGPGNFNRRGWIKFEFLTEIQL